MLKKTRKINNTEPTGKNPEVLCVPTRRAKLVAMGDVAPEKKLPPVPVPTIKTSVEKPQWQYHFKSKLVKQPLIDSYVIKQKLKLLPSKVEWFKLSALALLIIVIGVPAVSAFEAHIVNVTAVVANIDPPVLTPPGSGTAWDNTDGGTNLSGTIDVQMSDSDTDAANIFYTFGAGTDPNAVANPTCSGTGGDKNAPQHLSINTSTVIKAIACESANTFQSVTNTKIYSFGEQVNGLLINEFLPNPTGTDSGNRGVANGQNSGNGGEWVELYNNSSSTIDVDGFVLYDNFVPSSTPSSNTWTTTNDFTAAPVPVASGTVVNSGSVKLNASTTVGTFEKIFDIGTNKKAAWNNLSMSTFQNNAANTVCASVATSDDGVNFTPYTDLAPCATQSTSSVSSSLSPLSGSRFIKWKTTHTASSTSTLASLDSLTISYNFTDYNLYHELVITGGNTNTGGTTIGPSGFLVVYRDGNGSFELNTPSNSVSLYDGHIYNNATLIDSHSYNFGGPIPVNKSFARVPDGSSNWIDPCPTPGWPNVKTECDSTTITDPATTTPDVILDAPTVSNTDSTTTPDTNPTTAPDNVSNDSTSTPPLDVSPDASTTTPSSTPPSDLTTSDSNQPDSTSTPPSNQQNNPPSPKQDEAIVPQQQQQDQDVAPAPITGSGDGAPPPTPNDGPQATSTSTQS